MIIFESTYIVRQQSITIFRNQLDCVFQRSRDFITYTEYSRNLQCYRNILLFLQLILKQTANKYYSLQYRVRFCTNPFAWLTVIIVINEVTKYGVVDTISINNTSRCFFIVINNKSLVSYCYVLHCTIIRRKKTE